MSTDMRRYTDTTVGMVEDPEGEYYLVEEVEELLESFLVEFFKLEALIQGVIAEG